MRTKIHHFKVNSLPAPYPLGTFGASLLAPLALVPPLKNPGYAPDNSSEEFQRQQRVFANVSRTATDRTVVRRTNRPMRRSLQRLVDGEQVYKRLSLGRTRRQQAKRRRTGGDMHAIRGHWHHWIDRIRVPIRLPL